MNRNSNDSFSRLNFKQLRCFHAVAVEGSFTRAALALNVGQPSITTHVRALENYYGVELFARHGHSVQLTDIGTDLLEFTRRIFILEGESACLLQAASARKVGRLKVAAIGPLQVTDLALAFGGLYPDVELSITLGNSQDVLSNLLNFKSDVGIRVQIEDDPRFCSIPFSRDEVVIQVSSNHPWSGRNVIDIEELQDQRMVLREVGSATRKAFDDAIDAAGVKVREVLSIGSREAIREAVARGVGIGIALEEERVPDQRIHVLKVANTKIHLNAHVLCLQERRQAPLVDAFLQVAKNATRLPPEQ